MGRKREEREREAHLAPVHTLSSPSIFFFSITVEYWIIMADEVLGVPSSGREPTVSPPLTQRETASLLRRGNESYDVLVSNELLRIAEDGGGPVRYKYTYKGRRVKPMKVSSKEYTRAVCEMRKYRRQSCMQITARVCQIFAFVISALGIMAGVLAINYQIEFMSRELKPVATQAQDLQSALPQIQTTVVTLSDVVGGLNAGINVVGDVAGGVQNIVDGITSNQTSQYVGDVVRNSSQVVNQTIQGLQEAGATLGDELSSVLAGNTTVVDGVSNVGDAFVSFGTSLWDQTQQIGNDIAAASTAAFCGALSFLCDSSGDP